MLAKSSSQLRFAQALLVYSYRMKYGRRSNDGPQMHESCQIFGLLDSHDQLMLPVTMSDGRGRQGWDVMFYCGNRFTSAWAY